MKKISISMFLVLAFLAGAAWANAQTTEQAEANLRYNLEGAKAPQAAAVVPAQPEPLAIPLESVPVKTSIAHPKLLPTLHLTNSERTQAQLAVGGFTNGALVGAIAAWLTASHHLAATVALGAWTGGAIGLGFGLIALLVLEILK